MTKKRLTLHNQKGRRGRGFSAAHNDRTNTEKAEHIDTEKSANNLYWTHDGEKDFIESELRYYDSEFRTSLEAKNQRYIKNGHPERCQTMIDYYKSEKSAPDETLLYVGKKGDTIDRDNLWKLAVAYRDWITKEYPQYKPLSIALHTDEGGAPHLHFRGVFIGHDKDGNAVVGMEKALKEMGVERPNLKKAEGRHNNRKMTFTAACREKFQHLCKQAGIELETTPQERSKSGLSLLEYRARQEEEKAAAAVAQREAEEKQIAEIERRVDAALARQKIIDESDKKLNEIQSRAKKKGAGFLGLGSGGEIVEIGINDYRTLLQIAKSTTAADAAAADARAARSAADARASKIEKEANQKIKQARKEVQDAQDLAAEKDKEWFDYQQSMAVFEFAPEDLLKQFETERSYRAEAGDEINRLAARVGRLFKGSKERVYIMGKALDYIGIPQAEQADYIKDCLTAAQRKGKPRREGLSVGGWHPDPPQTNYTPPAELPKWLVEEVAPLINPPVNDDKSLSGTPWEWLSEMERYYLQHKNDFVDDY